MNPLRTAAEYASALWQDLLLRLKPVAKTVDGDHGPLKTPTTKPRPMELNTILIKKIRQVVRFFETSRVEGADYSALAIMNDGPNQRVQITYGASQTTEYGNLKALLSMYIDAKGKYAADIKSFIGWVGERSRPSLSGNGTFIELLKKAGSDPIMQRTQDQFFNIHYFNPARQWAEVNGFKLPLSMLVIYDSYIHSGSILQFLRTKFVEKVPAQGGKEKEWISQYVQTRDFWLETHSTKLLQNTDYRTDSFIYAIREDNWDLSKPFTVVNYPDPNEEQVPKIIATIP